MPRAEEVQQVGKNRATPMDRSDVGQTQAQTRPSSGQAMVPPAGDLGGTKQRMSSSVGSTTMTAEQRATQAVQRWLTLGDAGTEPIGLTGSAEN